MRPPQPCLLPLAVLLLAAAPVLADSAGVEFFEKKVRPVLAEHCTSCHGPKRQKANLRLDSVSGLLKGGDRGPVIVPGDPQRSLLIQAIRYGDENLQMPPRSKLRDELIADLTAWVARGSPVPKEDPSRAAQVPAPGQEFDLAARRLHWAYQPVRAVSPPTVQQGSWPRTPIDAFLLARLEAAGLAPAPPVDRRTLLRRVTFDLVGLPPTSAELDAFLADTSPDAFTRVVDRLLASPHYGERWGRHWLDLVRYAETLGHEFDYDLHHAWRYRDYVVRAFNADVPFDQFVVEHIAGDLLPAPRRHPIEGFNESAIGTAFWWLGEGKHSPVDLRQEQAERIDNQIDVFGKAFLGQTLACARCHDHKFDAITARDYYGLFGYLKSSRYQQVFLDPPERIETHAERLEALRRQARTRALASWAKQLETLERHLLATHAAAGAQDLARTAQKTGVDSARLQRWITALQTPAVQRPDHPLHAWVQLTRAAASGRPVAEAAQAMRTQVEQQQVEAARLAAATRLVARADETGLAGWFVTGHSFRSSPNRPGDVVLSPAPGSAPVRPSLPGQVHSGLLSARLEGALRSPTFTLEGRYVHYLAAGRGSRINLVIDGFTLIRDPIYGGLTLTLNDDRLAWRTMDVSMWQGRRAYIEVIDSATPDLARSKGEQGQAAEDGHVVLAAVRMGDERTPPPEAPCPLPLRLLSPEVRSLPILAERYEQLVRERLAAWQTGAARWTAEDMAVAQLLHWLVEQQLLDPLPLEDLLAEYARVEASLPAPTLAPGMADGTGEDEHVFGRGSYRAPGERAPRRLPEVIGGPDQSVPVAGSGRLEMARRLTAPTNPLLARVLVNRLWKHHFGEGLVRTPDDFGRMGEPPSHPELLDYLATEFVRSGWSIKHMHRLMLGSSAYQMSGRGDPAADERDPQNRLLHRMPLRRLEAEAIRDALLAVSGSLNPRLEGPSVPPHLTSFMEGRGRPRQSGPLDGEGRRSLYINVRRNFLTPMFLAFDYPTPFTCIGRRSVSNVPAQALTLMNEPFVVQQARLWAERMLAAHGREEPAKRVQVLYATAFARPADAVELQSALAFLDEQRRRDGGKDEVRPWADLCHVLVNLKEFVFIP